MAQNDDFSRLQQAEYEGVVFPVSKIKILTGSSAAFHKFPHRPGQRIEFMGRDPVTGVMVCPMFNTLFLEGSGRNVYWPDGVQLLQEKSQEQKSGKLVVPVFGTLDKAIIHVEADYDAAARDGCMVTINFAEDRGDLITKGTISATGRLPELASNLDNKLAALKILVNQKLEDAQGNTLGDFTSCIGALLAMKEQSETSLRDRIAFATRISTTLSDLISTAASTFDDPVNWEAREALLDLSLSVRDSAKEGSEAARKVKGYVTARAMSVADVATATKNKVEDLIALNTFPDFNDIAANEIVVYYADAA